MAPSKSSQEEGAAPLQPSNESSQSRQQAAEAAVRPRLRWTPELHERFLDAVKELKVAPCRLQLLPCSLRPDPVHNFMDAGALGRHKKPNASMQLLSS